MKKQVTLATLPFLALAAAAQNQQPNVLLIVADDLGMGDVSAYGSETISTPNIDRIGQMGVLFTNAYATSATSTPSRYALFTGVSPYKNPRAKILPGDAPLIIEPNQPTMPKMFQALGYATAGIGKWHLGMGLGNPDWNQPIDPSPNSIGFDYTCVVAATNDRVPTVYVQNGNVVGLDPDDPIEVSYEHNFPGEPTGKDNPELLRMLPNHGHNQSIVNGIPRIGYMRGGQKAKWVDEDMADYFLGLCKDFLDNVPEGKPFFLYYGLHEPHVPRLPNERFAGKSGLGPRGDVILEADWCVGEILSYLEKKGVLDNTIVIFTSDNGAVVQDGYKDMGTELLGNHQPSNGMRGGKYSLFEGGAHIPMMAYWKGHTAEGKVSDAMISQMDIFASLAAITGGKVAPGVESRDFHRTLLGKSKAHRRELILEASGRLCYRSGHYALIPPYKGKMVQDHTGIELGNFPEYALFDLRKDPAQTTDISAKHKLRVWIYKRRFLKIVGEHYNGNTKAEKLQ
ncbi:MAG: sulfatase-like hydrolase/transferase [Bacteroidales bacterium]|nr:sulfatase-like hydrolase/transferase [Bacteroidales bacterium]